MEVSLRSELKYLAPYLRPHRKALGLSLILSLTSTGLGLVQPYFAKLLIDEVFLGGKRALLMPLLSALVALLVLSFGVRMANSFLYTRYSAGLLFKMREDLFAHLQKAPLGFFAKRKIGDIYSRIATDMADVQGLLTETIPHYAFNLVTCLITAGILLWLNWKMALLTFVCLPLAVVVTNKIQPKLLALARSVAEHNADLSHFLFESLSSTSLVRAFNAEHLEGERLRERQSRLLDFLLQHQVLKVISGSVPTVIIVVNTLVVFGYGGFLVLSGSLTIGSLVAFSIYQGRVFPPLQGLFDGYLALQKARVALSRVREILAIAPATTVSGEVQLQDGELKGTIAFEQVSFAYEGEEWVVQDLSFQVPCASVTALMGPSGAGKSTICHLVLRLFDPQHGRITLDGIDLQRFDLQWLRRHIALVSQDTFLFHTSVGENIRFARPDASPEQIMEAARAAGIHEFIASLPQGYETVVGDRGVRLSGGERQRISIARAILTDPRILILDEATAFLDALTEERIKAALQTLMQGRTVLVVSHRASSVEGAGKIVVLEGQGPAGFTLFKESEQKGIGQGADSIASVVKQ